MGKYFSWALSRRPFKTGFIVNSYTRHDKGCYQEKYTLLTLSALFPSVDVVAKHYRNPTNLFMQ